MGIRLKQSTKNRGLSPIIEKNVVCPLLLSITLNLMILLRIFFAFKRVFGLVIDFGTSQSPKSTRPLTTYWCPSRPGHQALRNNFASSLLLRTWLPMTGRRVRRPTLFSLWRKARRENSAASRLLGSTSLRFALHGWQRGKFALAGRWWHLHSDINAWWREDCGVFCWFWYSSSTGHCSVLDC